MINLKEIDQIKELIDHKSSSLAKPVLEYIFTKLHHQRPITNLKEISFQYYTLLKDREYLNKVHTRFVDQDICKIFSIQIQDSEDLYNIHFDITPTYSIFDSKIILKIGDFLSSFVNFKKKFNEYLKNKKEYSKIYSFVTSTPNMKELLSLIDYFIDSNGNIKDDSTPELKKIRHEISSLSKIIPQKLTDFIRQNSKYLVSNEVSYRSGRFVICVNSQYVSMFEGIIQDYSWTHKTAFFEPSSIISYNNRLLFLRSLENIEIQKILNHLYQKICENLRNISQVLKVCSFLEFFNAYFSICQTFCLPNHNTRIVDIENLINPLIENCVPIDVKFERGLMIVGPNNGGKSVALKSITICFLLSNIGLPVFCTKANLPVLKVFYDVTDPQSIQENLSTFSGHVKYWQEIIRNLDSNTLVIMDEPASGTDPIQASLISISIIEYILNKGAYVVFSTHYNHVKNYFYDKITCCSVAYNFEKNISEYKLIYGILLPSLPLNLLKDFPEEILNKIQELQHYFSSEEYHAKLEKISHNLLNDYQNVQQKQKQLDQLIYQLEQEKQNLERLKNNLKQKIRDEIYHKLYNQYSVQIKNLISKWEEELQKLKTKNIHKFEKKLESLKNFDLADHLSYVEENQTTETLNVNDFVKIRVFDQVGRVVKIKGNKVTVEVNGRTYTVGIQDIQKFEI